MERLTVSLNMLSTGEKCWNVRTILQHWSSLGNFRFGKMLYIRFRVPCKFDAMHAPRVHAMDPLNNRNKFDGQQLLRHMTNFKTPHWRTVYLQIIFFVEFWSTIQPNLTPTLSYFVRWLIRSSLLKLCGPDNKKRVPDGIPLIKKQQLSKISRKE